MDDREFDEMAAMARASHHSPPPAPADRMWSGIAAARAARRRRRAWWQAGLAAAAVLVVGIAIGRFGLQPDRAAAPTIDVAQPTTVDPTPDDPPVKPIVRFAAASLFRRADALLTGLQTAGPAAPAEDALPAWAGGMLAQTRLLLDSPLADDAETHALLQDLELVLARIASLEPGAGADDVERIRQDLRESTTLDRLRLAGGTKLDPRLL